ncbi:unnamed protein product [Rotaria sp. Silwood1]|nr:unnamed protein product [Rotaria sp. Silwood1]CAF1653812.1 unnamed protein product [Rotaria sp. Silwood1]CAF3856236.1 unnamed protein product [Rotaria sp. Silwood1]CAF4944570.1 unnamed protein product [Rotaria sp. Silwood1]
MHAVFRIGHIQKLDNNRPLYQVNRKLTSDDNPQLRQLTNRLREEIADSTGWTRLGKMLLKLGQLDKAEELFTAQLEQTSDESDKAFIYNELGRLKSDQEQYTEAVLFYEKSLEINRKTLPKGHSNLATSYNNIGVMYKKNGR